MTTDDAVATDHGTFMVPISADPTSGWLCLRIEGSATLLGTGKAKKIRARVNGHAYEGTMLPVGGGTHMLPVRAGFRREHGLALGDEVELTILQ